MATQQPRSWAEDCNTYREARGAKSFASLNTSGEASTSKTMTEAPRRYARTNKVPFAETRHKLYSYDDQYAPDGGRLDQTRQDPGIQADRYDRHGWGDTSLLKEEGYSGVPHPHARIPERAGKGIPTPPCAPDGRSTLFGVLQQTEAGEKDSWIGNQLMDPAKGKRAVGLPPDPKGRQDLFDVLHARRPGVASDDSWLGNRLIDPARGKAHPPGPEELRGRRDLTDVYSQSILREPVPRKYELLRKGGDPLSDGWVGHHLINPNMGKAPPAGDVKAAHDTLRGATFKGVPEPGYSDFPRPHQKSVQPTAQDSLRDVVNGTARGEDWGKFGRRPLSEPLGTTILPERKDNLYAHMTFKPLSKVEQEALGHAFDDSKFTGRRPTQNIPGQQEPGKGSSMLHWNDKQRIGTFVRKGGLAQEGRKVVH